MRNVSLTAKLATAFALITLLLFGALADVLYEALAHSIAAQDDLDIVLAARHFRHLASEFKSLQDVPVHEARLDSLVLGNRAFVMTVQSLDGRTLVEYNPTHTLLPLGVPVSPAVRIVDTDIRQWRGSRQEAIRGISTAAVLRDGSVVNFVVARDMSDRQAFLRDYRAAIYVACASGMLLAFLLGYYLIRASLKPVRAIAQSAAQITVNRLDTRIDTGGVPQEFMPMVAAFNAMLGRLQTSFTHLSQSTSDLAHDLRTPVSNMRGASEVALARPRSAEEYQALLASNLEECERVSRMIENVLFLARAEHPAFVTLTARFDLQVELMRIAEYFEGLAEDAGVTLQVRASGEMAADLELFRRGVSNLLANALRYTARGGVIELSCEQSTTGTRVTVANPGVPIGAEHLDKLFDRFYRVDLSRTNPSGSTGLGLAIVRSIMELHGGHASVQSDPTSTRFHLDFPRR